MATMTPQEFAEHVHERLRQLEIQAAEMKLAIAVLVDALTDADDAIARSVTSRLKQMAAENPTVEALALLAQIASGTEPPPTSRPPQSSRPHLRLIDPD